MKKFCIVMLVLAVAVCGFSACGDKKPEKIKYIENVSHYETHAYRADTADYLVEISAGVKEKPFVADGKVGETVEFQTVKITPKKNADATELDFKVKYEGGEFSGKAQKDKFGPGYTANIDIGENVGKIESVSVAGGKEIPLENLLDGKIGWEDAFKVATETLKDFIGANLDEKGKFKKEICVKYLMNPYSGNGEYYWYVAFIGEGFDYTAILVNPTDGKVVAK